MKKHIILLLCIALALTACSLDETPQSELPESEAYTSAKMLYLNTVATLYNYIGGYEESSPVLPASRYSWAATKP